MKINFEEDHNLSWSQIIAAEMKASEIVQQATSDLCVNCGQTVSLDTVDAYPHNDGWQVLMEIPKQWLSIHCHACDYDISLGKLGVPR